MLGVLCVICIIYITIGFRYGWTGTRVDTMTIGLSLPPPNSTFCRRLRGARERIKDAEVDKLLPDGLRGRHRCHALHVLREPVGRVEPGEDAAVILHAWRGAGERALACAVSENTWAALGCARTHAYSSQ